jgi:hypothetical protein
MKLQKGARPIRTKELFEYYQRHNFTQYSVDKYCEIFYNWIINSQDKTITGLDRFAYRSSTQGTSQSFDNFVLRHAYKKVVNFAGDFQYHACISRNINHEVLSNVNELKNGQALIISFPFSDTGSEHKDFREILQACNRLDIPVCLDIAYWGIAKDLNLDLNQWSCIQEVVCSLSKPFYVLETHRVGVRFSKDYADDGICMINEVGMSNSYSMSLGCWFMTRFSNSYNWQKYSNIYYDICDQLSLKPTNTVIFGLGDQRYSEFFRGIPGNHRVCISEYLNEN